MTFALALPAAAHKAVGRPALSCDEVSVQLEDFPSGIHTITFHIKVNGTESAKTDQSTGPDGAARASISDLTTATGTLNIEALADWTVDGGGKSETAELTTVCHAPQNPPTSETAPERPVEVGAATAERAPAAAAPVTAAPRFTG